MDREVSADDGLAISPRDHSRDSRFSQSRLRFRSGLRPRARSHAIRHVLPGRKRPRLRARRREGERPPRERVPRWHRPRAPLPLARARQGRATHPLRRPAARERAIHVRAIPVPDRDSAHALCPLGRDSLARDPRARARARRRARDPTRRAHRAPLLFAHRSVRPLRHRLRGPLSLAAASALASRGAPARPRPRDSLLVDVLHARGLAQPRRADRRGGGPTPVVFDLARRAAQIPGERLSRRHGRRALHRAGRRRRGGPRARVEGPRRDRPDRSRQGHRARVLGITGRERRALLHYAGRARLYLAHRGEVPPHVRDDRDSPPAHSAREERRDRHGGRGPARGPLHRQHVRPLPRVRGGGRRHRRRDRRDGAEEARLRAHLRTPVEDREPIPLHAFRVVLPSREGWSREVQLRGICPLAYRLQARSLSSAGRARAQRVGVGAREGRYRGDPSLFRLCPHARRGILPPAGTYHVIWSKDRWTVWARD